MGARHGLGRDILRRPTYMYHCMCLLEVLTAARHRSVIREPIVRPLSGPVGDAFILMQYNAHAHTTRVYKTFLDDNGISVVNWPAMSPDINPIEHV